MVVVLRERKNKDFKWKEVAIETNAISITSPRPLEENRRRTGSPLRRAESGQGDLALLRRIEVTLVNIDVVR
jgi:hypothetical protein